MCTPVGTRLLLREASASVITREMEQTVIIWMILTCATISRQVMMNNMIRVFEWETDNQRVASSFLSGMEVEGCRDRTQRELMAIGVPPIPLI